jgi:hypothetical protein
MTALTSAAEPQSSLPLANIPFVEFTHIVISPACCVALGDLGGERLGQRLHYSAGRFAMKIIATQAIFTWAPGRFDAKLASMGSQLT